MIKVTKMNKEEYYLNEEKIELIEEVPDTIITLDNGKKLVVSESVDVVVERIRTEKTTLMRALAEGYAPKSGDRDPHENDILV